MGRIAIEAGQDGAAVKALAGLEAELPLAKDEIERWYAEAAAVAGPYDEAAKLLERSAKVRDLVRAADCYLKADELKAARKVADRAVKRARRTRRKADEERAHDVRARIAEKAKDVAVASIDWTWVVDNGNNSGLIRAAIAGVDRVGGKLRVEQRADALARSTTRDNLEATLAIFDKLTKDNKPKAADIALARARAIYSTRDYSRALAAFDEVAKLPTGYIAEVKYYAARCAVRSGAVEDGLTRYQQVSKRYTSTLWAERAAYRRAELLLLLGRYDDAAAAFTHYGARYAKGDGAEKAMYGRAMALLSGGKAKAARPLFSALVKKTDNRRMRASLEQLEGLARLRAGDDKGAKKTWLALIDKEPLTWPAMVARARLEAAGHAPLPPVMAPPKATAHAALPIALPEGPALFHSLGLDGAAERRLARIEQEAAARYPGRESEALCEMYGQLSGAGRRQKVGNRAVALDVLMRPPSPAERWAWHCVYPSPYPDILEREEKRYALPRGLLASIMRQESAFNPTAISPVGARGLMQLMPNTAKRAADEISLDLDLDEITRPDVNVKLGAYYISKMLRNFAGNLPAAIAAYNAGPHAVKSWLSARGDLEADVWVARIPYRETRLYVQRVMSNLHRYQWLLGGNEAVQPVPITLPESANIGDDAY